MATTQFKINGVIDTSQNVLTNINTLATAAGAFVTWDPSTGTWSVIKNDVGTPVANFNDSNIIGNINVSGSGINDLYNAVTIEFPHQDLKDTRDYIDLEIPEAERFPQELDNRLEIRLECINNPVQAQFIASRELKQSRVDKIIEFSTSFLGNGISAGDLISVTNSVYGYTNKIFRVITISEEDAEDSGIVFRIQGLEYDPAVYSTDGLVRKERNKKTGITPKAANEVILAQDAAGTAFDLSSLLPLIGIQGLLALLNGAVDADGNPQEVFEGIAGLTPFVITHSTSEVQSIFNEYAGNPGFNASSFAQANDGIIGGFTLFGPVKYLIMIFGGALSTYGFETANGPRSGFTAYIPSQIDVAAGGVNYGQYTTDWQTNNTIAIFQDMEPGDYFYRIVPQPTYDLDQATTFNIWPKNHVVEPNSLGAGITITFLGFNF